MYSELNDLTGSEDEIVSVKVKDLSRQSHSPLEFFYPLIRCCKASILLILIHCCFSPLHLKASSTEMSFMPG